jgi:hypothetical protein
MALSFYWNKIGENHYNFIFLIFMACSRIMLGGGLSVKFRIYVCQMTILKEGIKLLSNLFFITLLLSNF